MHRTMMPATEWDGELIADLATERARLRESEVMGIRRLAAAHETRLLSDVAKVLPVAIAARCSDPEDALVDALPLTNAGAFGGGKLLGPGSLGYRRLIVRGYSRVR